MRIPKIGDIYINKITNTTVKVENIIRQRIFFKEWHGISRDLKMATDIFNSKYWKLQNSTLVKEKLGIK